MHTRRSSSAARAGHRYRLTRTKLTADIDATLRKQGATPRSTFLHAVRSLSDVGASGIASKANETLEQMRQDVVFNRTHITPNHLRLMCIAGGIDVTALFRMDRTAHTAVPTGNRLSDSATEQKAEIWSQIVKETLRESGGGPSGTGKRVGGEVGDVTEEAVNKFRTDHPKAANRVLWVSDAVIGSPIKSTAIATLASITGVYVMAKLFGGIPTAIREGMADLQKALKDNNVPHKYYLRMNKERPNITHADLQVLTKQEFDDLMTDIEIDSRNRNTIYTRIYLDKSERVRQEHQQQALEQLQTRMSEVLQQEKLAQPPNRVLTQLVAKRDVEKELLVRDIPYDFFTNAKKATFRPAKLNRLLRQAVVDPDSFFGSGHQKFAQDEIDAVHALYYNVAVPPKREAAPFSAVPAKATVTSAIAAGPPTPMGVLSRKPAATKAPEATMGTAQLKRASSALSTIGSMMAVPAGILLYLWLTSTMGGMTGSVLGASNNPTFSKLYNDPLTHKTIGKDAFHRQSGSYNGMLASVDPELHHVFQDYHRNTAEEVDRLRYQLLELHRQRLQDAGGQGEYHDRKEVRAILPLHFFRPDGAPRESPLEMALAIKHHTKAPRFWTKVRAAIGQWVSGRTSRAASRGKAHRSLSVTQRRRSRAVGGHRTRCT